ncbi:hypothetical protein JCM21900_002017 [Sporobolomyces salmonicolor]
MSALLDVANLEPDQLAPSRPPSLPSAIPTAQRVRIVNGIQTDVLVQSFADRILVLVTQLGRIGCMIQVSPPPPTLPSSLPPPGATISSSLLPDLPPPHPSTLLNPLFGVPPTPHVSALHDLYASQIGAIVFRKFALEAAGGGAKPVVLGIGLKLSTAGKEEDEEGGVSEEERGTFREIMEMVLECIG